MELRVIHYFLAVVQEKTISGAAKQLHVSQPTLSKQLKELEEELGVTLFIRGNRQIQLTPEGEYLAKQGQDILSLANKTVTNLSQNEFINDDWWWRNKSYVFFSECTTTNNKPALS